MTERHTNRFELFISPGANGVPGDGTAVRPLADMKQALAEIAERYGGESPSVKPLAGYDQIEVASIEQPGSGFKLRKRPRHSFTIDPLGTGEDGGNGSNTSPWTSLEDALKDLTRLADAGKLALQPGERLRISVREVFSITPVDRRKRLTESIARGTFMLMTLALAIPVLFIMSYLVTKAWPALSWSFLVENPRNNWTAGGIWAPLVGTFYLVFISLLVAAPIGILAGVYLNEYARDNWFTRIVNLAVVNLAGVPSIVHALFGVGAFVLFLGMDKSVLAASCTLAVMTLPVIITSTKEALASVPQSFRMACWNMGATRWQTIRSIVLPNSISGILTGVILQVSRAAGETAPILFTGAVASTRVHDEGLRYVFQYSLRDSCMALSYHLHTLVTQVRPPRAEQIASGESMPLEHLQYGTAVVLIGLVLTVNALSIGLRTYLRSRKKW